MPKKLVAYYRPFPWHRIGAKRTGRTSVERSLRAACREQGAKVAAFLVETDDSILRSLEDRCVGRQVMSLLRTDRADGIIVLHPEHIFSSASEAASSLERWIDQGIEFHCVDYDEGAALTLLPGRKLDGRVVIRGLSELQRRIDVEKAHRRVMNRKASGTWRGHVPFGFKSVDGMLVEEPDRIERIVQMKQAHRRGISYRRIARTQGVSIATVHRLVQTDLRKLRRIGSRSDDRPAPRRDHSPET